MRYVLKNQEMQTVDHETIHGIGIPGLVLMERASKAVADKAAQIADHSQRILIISGIGNNGGDALACTRILLEQDFFRRVDFPEHVYCKGRSRNDRVCIQFSGKDRCA